MQEAGRRIATPRGAMLADPAGLGHWLDAAGETLFKPGFWSARGSLAPASLGRGAAWFIETGAERWVLRHYRRGGSVARMLGDWYVWTGEERVRSFEEFRLLAGLYGRGLPVPMPIAARYQRSGPAYRCDLIMRCIADAVPLSTVLSAGTIGDESWRAVGATIARLHHARVDHADLNAHNILVGSGGKISLIDFDRGRLRVRSHGRAGTPSAWAERNLNRLHRSLEKISRDWPADRFSPAAWSILMAGYASFSG